MFSIVAVYLDSVGLVLKFLLEIKVVLVGVVCIVVLVEDITIFDGE